MMMVMIMIVVVVMMMMMLMMMVTTTGPASWFSKSQLLRALGHLLVYLVPAAVG